MTYDCETIKAEKQPRVWKGVVEKGPNGGGGPLGNDIHGVSVPCFYPLEINQSHRRVEHTVWHAEKNISAAVFGFIRNGWRTKIVSYNMILAQI